MIPTGGTLQTVQAQPVQQPSRTYRLDLESKRIVGMIDGLEAVKQAVFKITQTERFRFLIYSFNYGFESNGLIGATPAFVRSELKRRLREALIQDDRITGIEAFQFTPDGDNALVQFTVVSQYGRFQVSQGVPGNV